MLRGIKRSASLTGLVLALFIAPASMGAGLDDLMLGFAKTPSAQARFEETRQMAALSSPLILKGRLEFMAPDRLVKHVDGPRQESYILHQGRLTIERQGEASQAIDVDSHPALQSLSEAFRATLAGDLASLQRHFKVTFANKSADHWSIELVPLDARVAEHVEKLVLSGKGSSLLQATTLETGGDRSDMRITPQ